MQEVRDWAAEMSDLRAPPEELEPDAQLMVSLAPGTVWTRDKLRAAAQRALTEHDPAGDCTRGTAHSGPCNGWPRSNGCMADGYRGDTGSAV